MLAAVLLALTSSLSLPAPTGPYHVGTDTTLYTDASRRDLVDPSQPRTILVQYWYPARATAGIAPLRYMSPTLLQALRADKYLNVDVNLLNGWDSLATHTTYYPFPVKEKVPLLLFAPGMGMSRASYTTLAEELASRGIVVAIADHPYCGLSIYPDGRLRSYMAVKEKPPIRVRDIAADQSFILNQIKKHPPVQLNIDWSHISVGGHSIGGAAALQTTRTDSRIRNAIDLDGDVWGDVEASGTRKPFLVLLNQPGPPVVISARMKKERTDEWIGVVDKSPVPSRVITIGPAYHFTFSDTPFLLPAEELKSNGATLEPSKGRSVIASLIAAYMTGDSAAVDALIGKTPEARVLLRRPAG